MLFGGEQEGSTCSYLAPKEPKKGMRTHTKKKKKKLA